ncbi:MAG: hypothetical protein KIY10_03770 [Thermoplasmata archaeon]|jgi:hypothetical protein|nr:hypothetical protein [Candidatus Sysuiplasma jiujiangense]MBX8640443.1 hypothetical protein [Candidatus Sysuiplasma jiujiangense]MBX8641674.1 hypothetical protein [Candidatus Sysuiplasma jiujiangense]
MQGHSGRLTASAIATYVYCEMKYYYTVSPPPDYTEPEYVSLRKDAGLTYHSETEFSVRRQYSGGRVLIILGLIAAVMVAIIWFL